jgi:carbamate kinase
MGPKVEAALRFVDAGGPRSIITSLERITDALDGRHGTIVVPDDPAPRHT